MIEELAAAIRAADRPIAVLAGSGVSHSAGVPTGQNLLRDVAKEWGEDAGPDPVAWYVRSTGRFPDYFGMVGDGADTLPEAIFDRPTPTPAHRSIARMAAAGLIGPILTTNLDRLLERALCEAGVDFDVACDLTGFQRVRLGGVVVLKLHGDYRDIGIRHASPRLHVYPQVVEDLLQRVLSGYDLLVCGWSASWDVPLRRALRTAKGGRIWWLQCGPPSGAAMAIFKARQPGLVPVASSDAGLTELCEQVLSTRPGA